MQARLHALLAGHLRGPSQSPKPSPDKGITPGPCLNRLPVEVGVKLHRACWGRGGSGAQEPVPTWQAAECHESSPLPSSAGGGMRGHLLGSHGASPSPVGWAPHLPPPCPGLHAGPEIQMEQNPHTPLG